MALAKRFSSSDSATVISCVHKEKKGVKSVMSELRYQTIGMEPKLTSSKISALVHHAPALASCWVELQASLTGIRGVDSGMPRYGVKAQHWRPTV
jgi:hypothetical protein